MIGVLAEDWPQGPLAGDQHPARALMADGGDPPSVRRRPRTGIENPHADHGEHRTGRGGELGVPVSELRTQNVVTIYYESPMLLLCWWGGRHMP